MAESKLTVRQEHFARLLFEGYTQTDAYREAFNAYDKKPKAIHELASRLARMSKVYEYIEEMRKDARSASIMSKKELMEWHSSKLRNSPHDDEDLASGTIKKTDAAKELAKLGDYYPSGKLEVTVDAIHQFAAQQMKEASAEGLVSE